MSDKTIRHYREQVALISARAYDLRSPIVEGYQNPPEMIEEGLTRLLDLCEELDREWAKSDFRKPVVV